MSFQNMFFHIIFVFESLGAKWTFVYSFLGHQLFCLTYFLVITFNLIEIFFFYDILFYSCVFEGEKLLLGFLKSLV